MNSVTKNCSINDCGKVVEARGWCKKHYERWRRHGDPNKTLAIHGGYRRRGKTYKTWERMKSRCYYPRDDSYRHYAGRGIKVCDRWIENFDNFVDDMGEPPSNIHSLDRIDNDGDYTPENCRWATPREQNLNQRRSPYVKGYSLRKGAKKKKWRAAISYGGKSRELGAFETEREAHQAYLDARKFYDEGVAK